MINKIPLIPPTKDSANSFFKVLKIIHEKNPKFILLESYIKVLYKKFDLDVKEKYDKNENDENKKDKDKDNNLTNDKISHFHGNSKREKSHGSKKSLGKYHNDKDHRRREKIRTRDREMDKSKDRQRERSRDRDKDKEYKKDEKNFDNRRFKSVRIKRK